VVKICQSYCPVDRHFFVGHLVETAMCSESRYHTADIGLLTQRPTPTVAKVVHHS